MEAVDKYIPMPENGAPIKAIGTYAPKLSVVADRLLNRAKLLHVQIHHNTWRSAPPFQGH